MYANGNAAKVKSLDRAFLTEDDVNRKKGDIAGHTHVQAWFGSIIRSDRSSDLDAIFAIRACLQVVCGHLAMEKRWGTNVAQ